MTHNYRVISPDFTQVQRAKDQLHGKKKKKIRWRFLFTSHLLRRCHARTTMQQQQQFEKRHFLS